MNARWKCDRNRTREAAAWVRAKSQTGDPNMSGVWGDGNLEIKEITPIETSQADRELRERLETLGLVPRFRYSDYRGSYESWITSDGTTEISVILETKGLVLSKEKASILECPPGKLSFETWFEDRVILLAVTDEILLEANSVVDTEIGATDAQTFENHRRAVERRSKTHKVLLLENIDDMAALSFYSVRSTLGGLNDIYYQP